MQRSSSSRAVCKVGLLLLQAVRATTALPMRHAEAYLHRFLVRPEPHAAVTAAPTGWVPLSFRPLSCCKRTAQLALLPQLRAPSRHRTHHSYHHLLPGSCAALLVHQCFCPSPFAAPCVLLSWHHQQLAKPLPPVLHRQVLPLLLLPAPHRLLSALVGPNPTVLAGRLPAADAHPVAAAAECMLHLAEHTLHLIEQAEALPLATSTLAPALQQQTVSCCPN